MQTSTSTGNERRGAGGEYSGCTDVVWGWGGGVLKEAARARRGSYRAIWHDIPRYHAISRDIPRYRTVPRDTARDIVSRDTVIAQQNMPPTAILWGARYGRGHKTWSWRRTSTSSSTDRGFRAVAVDLGAVDRARPDSTADGGYGSAGWTGRTVWSSYPACAISSASRRISKPSPRKMAWKSFRLRSNTIATDRMKSGPPSRPWGVMGWPANDNTDDSEKNFRPILLPPSSKTNARQRAERPP